VLVFFTLISYLSFSVGAPSPEPEPVNVH
jgi:hypothetical protein